MLESMCKNYPTSNEELSNINGISKGKAEKYGELFISKILEFVEKNSIRKNYPGSNGKRRSKKSKR